MWTTPAATEMRFGFEVTMYVMNKWFLLQIVINKRGLNAPFLLSSVWNVIKTLLYDS